MFVKKNCHLQDKRIQELEEQVKSMQRPSSNIDLEVKLSQLTAEKLQLETELKEANQQLTTSMQASFRVDSYENIRQLQVNY